MGAKAEIVTVSAAVPSVMIAPMGSPPITSDCNDPEMLFSTIGGSETVAPSTTPDSLLGDQVMERLDEAVMDTLPGVT